MPETEGPQTPAPGRRERKAAETRERIFRAAIELFAERGLASVTVEQITERADVGKGTFFNYFPTKEAVLAYFGGTQVERLRAALESGEIDGTPRDRVCQALGVLARHPALTQDLVRGHFISALSTHALHEIEGPSIWQIREILAGIIRDGQQQGQLRTDLAPEEMALFLLGQYFLAELAWCTGFADRSLAETVADYVTLALEGLSGRS